MIQGADTLVCPYKFILNRSPFKIPYDTPATKTIAAPLGISKKYDSQRPERVKTRLTKEDKNIIRFMLWENTLANVTGIVMSSIKRRAPMICISITTVTAMRKRRIVYKRCTG